MEFEAGESEKYFLSITQLLDVLICILLSSRKNNPTPF